MNIKIACRYPIKILVPIICFFATQSVTAQPVPFLNKDGKYQFVNAVTLKPINTNSYDVLEPFSEGLALAVRNNSRSYIRENGQEAFSLSGGEGSSFHGGRAVVNREKNCFLLDKAGKEYRVTSKVQAWTIQEGLAVAVKESGNFGYINPISLGEKIPFDYEFARPFSEGLAAVRVNGKWGFIDNNGTMHITAGFDDAGSFSEGLAAVKRGAKWGFINKNGEMIIPPAYDKTTAFVGGHAFVKQKENAWVVIDMKGQSAGGALSYQSITQLCDGLAGVMVNGKWGFANASGKIIIEPAYSIVSSFEHGIAMAVQNGQRFYIDTKGREFRSK